MEHQQLFTSRMARAVERSCNGSELSEWVNATPEGEFLTHPWLRRVAPHPLLTAMYTCVVDRAHSRTESAAAGVRLRQEGIHSLDAILSYLS